ncbi:MAG: YraN family protein [Lachnospiraceae bacterium]|nr:YraN family protein [Lachnospiraceae bacterium]
MNTRKTGTEYEQLAVRYLQKQGVRILECNYRNRKGEIDLIGRDGEYTVFFEVKYRKDSSRGYPTEAVNYRKRKTICSVADYYRMIHHMGEFTPIRYDVIAICGEEIVWYQNAFAHIYNY